MLSSFVFRKNLLKIQVIFPILILLSAFGPIPGNAFRVQSAGARGVLLCGEKPLGGAKVTLWDHDAGPDLDDKMGETVTDSKGRFQVSGKASEFTTIDVRLIIYHDCDDGIPCQRKVTFVVPDSYVSNGPIAAKIFNIGQINLEIGFKDEARSCINKIR